MHKIFQCCLFLGALGTIAATPVPEKRPSKPVVILVPGTANRLFGKYYSPEVYTQLREAGFEVHFADHLIPFGGYITNGKLITPLIDRNCSRTGTWLIGHSAGGLYALASIKQSHCPVRGVIAIGSPLKGARLAEVSYKTLSGKIFRRMLPWLYFETRVFEDYVPEAMPGYYEQITPVPHRFRLVTFAGVQPIAKTVSQAWDARYLSPHLSYFSTLMGEPSDGLVTVDSAFGEGVKLKAADGSFVAAEPQKPALAIDHIEQFKKGYFNFMHTHVDETLALQKKLYDDIISLIKSDKGP